MDYSIIFPVYNEEENIGELYTRTKKVLEGMKSSYEIIFINDGSTDKTALLLHALHEKDATVKIVNFSRNFGHQNAVTAGLKYSTGTAVAILDADIQDPPEILPDFFAKLDEGYDVVYAIRKNRKEGLLKRMAYSLFYRFLSRIAEIDMPLDSGDFCVMKRRVVDAVNMLPERNRFIRGLRSWVGYKQVGLPYERSERSGGESKYTLSKLFKLAFDGIFSFSYFPLQLMFTIGTVSLVVSSIGVLVAMYFRFFTPFYKQVPGFATTIILVMFIGGLQLFTLGLLGEYLRRVYDEIKNRPSFIVESTLGLEKK